MQALNPEEVGQVVVPAKQEEQKLEDDAPAIAEYLPAPQLTHDAPPLYVPRGQLLQEDEPVELTKLTPHAKHTVAPDALANVLLLHTAHALADVITE